MSIALGLGAASIVAVRAAQYAHSLYNEMIMSITLGLGAASIVVGRAAQYAHSL